MRNTAKYISDNKAKFCERALYKIMAINQLLLTFHLEKKELIKQREASLTC